MRTKRAAFLAIVASAVLSQAALAADLGGAPRRARDEPLPYAPAPTFSWTGLYIGTHVGYGWSDVDWQFDNTPGIPTGHTGGGGLAGGQIGYNVQVNHFVFGIEADLSGSWIDGSTACPNPAFNCGHNINWLGSVRGRLGAAVNGNRTLLYATGGAAWADVDYTAPGASGFSNTHFGWVAGGGIEHMLTQNLSARVEYLHYSFDDATGPVAGLATTVEPKLDTVRFGLNLKF